MVLAIAGWDRAVRRGRGDAGMVAAVLGAGVKLMPAMVLPALLRAPGPRRIRLIALAGSVAFVLGLSVPFWDAGSGLFFALGNYVSHWSFNGSLFPVLERGVLGLGGSAPAAREWADSGGRTGGFARAWPPGAPWRRRR